MRLLPLNFIEYNFKNALQMMLECVNVFWNLDTKYNLRVCKPVI